MSEDERVNQELRERAKRLIDETDSAYGALTSDLKPALAQWLVATQLYTTRHAREGERLALEEFSRRVGRRSIIFAQRSLAATERYEVERDLSHINMAIGGTQFLIGLGKLSEAALSIYAYVGKTKTAVDGLKFVIQGKKFDEVKDRIDSGKLVLDGVKAATAQAARVEGSIGGADYAMATAQIGAYLLRVGPGLDRTGKQIWDLIGLFRRANSCGDLMQFATMMLQLTKVLVDFARNLIDFIENMEPKSGLSPILGTISSVVTALRDLIDGVRAFIAVADSVKQMLANWAQMEIALRDRDNFIGSVPSPAPTLLYLDTDARESLALSAMTLHEARILVDEARLEAKKLKEDTEAAAQLQTKNFQVVRGAARGLAGKLTDMDELMTRMRYQMQDLEFVSGRGGPRAVVATELLETLKQKRDYFESGLSQLKVFVAYAQ